VDETADRFQIAARKRGDEHARRDVVRKRPLSRVVDAPGGRKFNYGHAAFGRCWVMSRPFIFLSYAREDKEQVDQVYMKLKQAGLDPWMDSPPAPYKNEGIPPGIQWELFIRDRIRAASQVLVFFSKTSVDQPGFRHKELRIILSRMAERPLHKIRLIPVLLDDCPVPRFQVDTLSFDQFQWCELRRDKDCAGDGDSQGDGVQRLIEYLKADADGEIGSVHLALIHSCWRASHHDEKYGKKVYRFDVMVSDEHSVFQRNADHTVLDRIEHVTYLLPPAWPTSPKTTKERETSFGLQELTWADLMVRANVYIKGQPDPVHLSSFVRTTENGPRLIFR
jgi:hypothetical protein